MRSEVQVFPDPPILGGIAQLGEHLLCKQGVRSSNLLTSTNTTKPFGFGRIGEIEKVRSSEEFGIEICESEVEQRRD